jgi:hypothetical protein
MDRGTRIPVSLVHPHHMFVEVSIETAHRVIVPEEPRCSRT